jgi:two-component system response regulator NreC
MNTHKSIKVAALSSRFLLSEGLKSLLTGHPDFVFSDHITGREHIEQRLLKSRPDVLIVDGEMPLFKDVEQLIQLKTKLSDLSLLIMADQYETGQARRLIEAGIQGLVYCSCDRPEIENAIYAICTGERFICGRILEEVLVDMNRPPEYKPVNLSGREIEIINSVAEGLSSKEIKEVLNLSVHTINTHKRNIYRKLGINKSSDLIRFALKNGMMENTVPALNT